MSLSSRSLDMAGPVRVEPVVGEALSAMEPKAVQALPDRGAIMVLELVDHVTHGSLSLFLQPFGLFQGQLSSALRASWMRIMGVWL